MHLILRINRKTLSPHRAIRTDHTAIMSAEYEGQDPLDIAKQAERDLNSHEAKFGHGNSTSGG